MSYLILLLSFLAGSLGAWWISGKGTELGLSDAPQERSSHVVVTPKGGGVGILVAFMILTGYFEMPIIFMLVIAFLSLLSLVGDRFEISPKIRLLIQVLVALSLLWVIFPFSENNYWKDSWWITVGVILFLLVYIVGTTNFYNFMDGINGIAAITGIVGFGLLAYVSFIEKGDSSFGGLSLGLALACLGFLPWNVPKAKVFMGDVGSILLGLTFASIVVAISKSPVDFMCFSGFLFMFYADEVETMLERVKKRDHLLKPHRKHLYQVLANEGGVDHWKISCCYGSLQFLISIFMLNLRQFGEMILFVALFFLFIVYAQTAKKTKFEIRRKLASPDLQK